MGLVVVVPILGLDEDARGLRAREAAAVRSAGGDAERLRAEQAIGGGGEDLHGPLLLAEGQRMAGNVDAALREAEAFNPGEEPSGQPAPGRTDQIAEEDKILLQTVARLVVVGDGARAAYEMIVLAYAEGDRRTLKNLLSRDVYEGFEAAIRERHADTLFSDDGRTVDQAPCIAMIETR